MITVDQPPSGAERILKIRNEDEAFDLLEGALSGAISDESTTLVDFTGWPIMDVRLPNTPINSSISPTMMEAFIELQTAIYRAHSLLTADSGDLRGLSKAEKDRLEFRVKVSDGSSEYVAELAKSLQTIGIEMVNKMTSADLVMLVVSVAIIVGGGNFVESVAFVSYRTTQGRNRQ